MQPHVLIAYAATLFVASIIPGPAMLLALTHGGQHGARKTIASALGNVVVTIFQAGISIAGLGAVLATSQLAFTVVKIAGAGFLIYMGIDMLRHPKPINALNTSSTKIKNTPLHKLFLQSAAVTGGNPKAIVFFSAVLPQFISPEAPHLIQFTLFTAISAGVAFICYMIYAVGGQQLVSVFSKENNGKKFSSVIGSIFIGAGIYLALSRR